MNLNFKTRIRIVYFLILLAAVVIGMRLFFIQVVKGDYYKSEASKQYNAFSYEDFDRGSIYFTEKTGGRISAAIVKNGYKAEINTRFLADRRSVQKLSEIIPMDKDFFMSKALKRTTRPRF